MSLCPLCGRAYCDHTFEERGQTVEEAMTFSEEEIAIINKRNLAAVKEIEKKYGIKFIKKEDK